MTLLFPTRAMGWDNVDRSQPRFVAFGRSSLTPLPNAGFTVSDDGLAWRSRTLEGDLGRNGSTSFGKFVPAVVKRAEHGLLVGGQIQFADARPNQAALFFSDLSDGVRWKRVTTGLENAGPSAFRRTINQIAEANGIVTVAIPDGIIAWSDDIETWSVVTIYSSPETLPQIATLDASTDKIVASASPAVGNPVFYVANHPAGPWATATPPFGNNTLASDIEASEIFVATNGTAIRTAPSAATPWTARTIPSGFAPNALFKARGRWFATNAAGGLITSSDGISAWTAVAGGTGASGSLNSWLDDGEVLRLFWSDGRISVGEYTDLELITGTGLAGVTTAGAMVVG